MGKNRIFGSENRISEKNDSNVPNEQVEEKFTMQTTSNHPAVCD